MTYLIRYCEICGTPKIYRRRATRSTWVCPHSRDDSHRATRRVRRAQAAVDRIERYIAGGK